MPYPYDDNYDDRPKKSWREIDKLRDGKRSSSGPSPEREKLERSGGYSRFKSAADAFFSGNLTPDVLREKLDPTGEAKARQDALQKVKTAEDPQAFQVSSKEYIDKYGLPDEDPYLLDRLLTHKDKDIVIKVLDRVTALLKAGGFKAPKSLAQRLKSLELGSDDPAIQDLAKAVGKLLRDAPR